MFEANPFSHSAEKNRLPMAVGTVNDSIAAWACAMETPVFLENKIVPAAFSCNTFTLPKYRRLGLGFRVQALIAEDYPIFWSISMSAGNRRNKLRAGGVPGKPLYICCRRFSALDDDALMRSFESALSRRKKYVQRIAGLVTQTGMTSLMMRLLSRIVLPVSPVKKMTADNAGCLPDIRQISSFNDEWDNLWENEIRPAYDFGVDRSAEYMNWKYVQQPHVSFQKYGIMDGNRLAGAIVYRLAKRPEIPVGIVTEFLVSSKYGADRFPLFIRRVTGDLYNQGALAAYWSTSDPVQVAALKKEGYRLIRINVPIRQMQNDLKVKWKVSAGKPHAKWLLSLGDQDQDQFMLRQQPSFLTLLGLLLGNVPGSEDLNEIQHFSEI